MVLINGIKIYFDFELGIQQAYVTKSIPYCNPRYINEIFKNVEIKNSIKLSKIPNDMRVLIAPSEFRAFIKAWMDKKSFHKFTDWTVEEWISEYLHDSKLAAATLNMDDLEDEIFFRDYAIEQISNLSIKHMSSNKSFIDIDVTPPPEYSWCIEDYLYCRLNKIPSEYKDYINEFIALNNSDIVLRNCQKNFINGISQKNNQSSMPLKIDIDAVEDKNLLTTFCYPYKEEEIFNTCVTHVRNTVQKYLKMKMENKCTYM